MMLLEVMIYWITIAKDILNRTFKHLIRWIFPFTFVSLYLATIYRGLNEEFDIRKTAAMVVALVFIIVGNYLPKKVQADREPMNRKWAYLFVLLGFIAFIVSISICKRIYAIMVSSINKRVIMITKEHYQFPAAPCLCQSASGAFR